MPDTDVTNINIIGLLFIFLMGILTILLPRRLAILPIILSACFMTQGQTIVVLGLHFYSFRIIILIGWVRLIVRRELSPSIGLNAIDKLTIAYAVVGFAMYNLLWQTQEAFVNQLGFVYNVIGIYFLCRFLISDLEDVERVIKISAMCSIPLAVFMIWEKLTGENIFSIFGGVPEIAYIRDDIIRSQGPFRHPILAGTFGAATLPLVIGLWGKGRNRKLWLLLAVLSCIVIVITSASSGPALALGGALLGLFFWFFRKYMRLILLGGLGIFISLSLVMKAPVWFLIARVNVLSSSTGWHRAYLIDQAINRFNEWWVMGTKETADWMPYALTSVSADITNQFIAEGLTGGMLKMILFVGIIVFAFRLIGKRIRHAKNGEYLSEFEKWAIGVSLFVHIVSFFSVSYFDQIILFWYLLLAMISALDYDSLQKKRPEEMGCA